MSHNLFDYLAFYAFVAFLLSSVVFIIIPSTRKHSVRIGLLFTVLVYVIPNLDIISLTIEDIFLVILNIATIFLSASGFIRTFSKEKENKKEDERIEASIDPNKKAKGTPSQSIPPHKKLKFLQFFWNRIVDGLRTKWL